MGIDDRLSRLEDEVYDDRKSEAAEIAHKMMNHHDLSPPFTRKVTGLASRLGGVFELLILWEEADQEEDRQAVVSDLREVVEDAGADSSALSRLGEEERELIEQCPHIEVQCPSCRQEMDEIDQCTYCGCGWSADS